MKTMFYYSVLQKYLYKKDICGLRHNITFSDINDKEKSPFVSKTSAINMTTCDDQQRKEFISLNFNYIQELSFHAFFLPFMFSILKATDE